MKKLILRGAIVTCALIVGALTTHAQTYTYEFAASAGQYAGFDGSTITIDTGGVESFSFFDNGFFYNSSNPMTSAGFTTANNITSYDSSGWTGEYDPFDPFIGFDATGTSMSDFAVDPSDPPLSYAESATGTWTTIAYLAPTGSIPDTAGTFWLLMGGMALLGGGRFLEPVRRK
jgi:hypothetical protein